MTSNNIEHEIIRISQDLVLKLVQSAISETNLTIQAALLKSKAEMLREEAKVELRKIIPKDAEIEWMRQVKKILENDNCKEFDVIIEASEEADSTSGESFLDIYLASLVSMATFALEQLRK